MESKNKARGNAAAKLYCVAPPTEEQKKGLADFLEKKYGVRPEIVVEEDKSLVSGFRLEYGGDVYDRSAKSRIDKIKQTIKGVSSEPVAAAPAAAAVSAVSAKLYCVTPPTDAQTKGIADFLERTYGVRPEVDIVIDNSVVGGVRLEYGDNVFDWSAQGRINK